MLDSTGFAELCTREFLWHRVWDVSAAKLESITLHGLDRVEPHYEGFWLSRSAHVYLGTLEKVMDLSPIDRYRDTPSALFRVDVSMLERERCNPDEDYWLTHNFMDHEVARRGERACRRWHLPFPPSNWAWEWGRYFEWSVPSLGEWAEQVDLGHDSAQTLYSLAMGSIAYNGVVPPTAIEHVRTVQP